MDFFISAWIVFILEKSYLQTTVFIMHCVIYQEIIFWNNLLLKNRRKIWNTDILAYLLSVGRAKCYDICPKELLSEA